MWTLRKEAVYNLKTVAAVEGFWSFMLWQGELQKSQLGDDANQASWCLSDILRAEHGMTFLVLIACKGAMNLGKRKQMVWLKSLKNNRIAQFWHLHKGKHRTSTEVCKLGLPPDTVGAVQLGREEHAPHPYHKGFLTYQTALQFPDPTVDPTRPLLTWAGLSMAVP